MNHAPKDIDRFCDPELDEKHRAQLTKWVRDIEDRSSCQSLQILFSFSIPTSTALEKILELNKLLVSAGAGTGYWEFLLQQKGADIVAFDQNIIFPSEMRYTQIQTGGPDILEEYPDRTLMMGWPDHEETSTFSTECLKHYKGDTVIHLGELFGETCSTNPWGQTTSREFQILLGETFRCMSRVQLPNWPGHCDSLTIWSRASRVANCDGAQMVYLSSFSTNPRYYGWQK